MLFPSPLVGEGGTDARSVFVTGEGFSPRIQTPHPARTSSSPPSPTRGEGKKRSFEILPDGQISSRFRIVACQAPFKKIFLFYRNANQSYMSPRPVPPKGRSHRHETRGGMRWTQTVLLTRAPDADGEVVWFWRLDAGAKSRGHVPARRRWQTSPVSGKSTKKTVKTIARGMPGGSGVLVVTTLVCFVFYCTRGCGRIERPAFPAPSLEREPDQNANLARKHAARSRSLCLAAVICRRKAELIQYSR